MLNRRSWTGLAVAILAVAALGAATAQAAPAAGAVCKSVSVSGTKYQWSVIGNVSCKEATPWLLRLLADRGTPHAKLTLKNAPKGFHCTAAADSKGRPTAGACYTGTLAFPKNGFQWFG